MVSLALSKKRFVKDVSMAEAKIVDRLTMLGVEVEESTEHELIVDITPNRPDLLSHQGLVRALRAFAGIEPVLREYRTVKGKLKVKVDPSLKDIRPYTACAVARNLKLDDELLRELIDLQEKLHVTFCRKRKRAAIGVYPMEAISGNITFLAKKPEEISFRPLESDKDMSAKEILEKHPKGREYAHLLEGLPMYPLFVDAKNNVLSMPPIINSHATGKVELTTKDIFIESSGSDERINDEIVRIMCAALADMGATIETVEVLYGRKSVIMPDMRSREQQFYGYYANRRLGVEIAKEDLPKLLGKMGLGFTDGRIRETYYALLPPYRVDILHQIDIVEDLAIAYGYERIPAQLPQLATVASESAATHVGRAVRQALVGQGLLEAKNYHLTNAALATDLGASDLVTLHSSVSEEYDAMRPDLLSGLLQTLVRNKSHEYPQEFFEIGAVFTARSESVREAQHLAIVLAGDADYTRIRQVLEGLLHALGMRASVAAARDARFMQGRCANVSVNGSHVGVLGEISPHVLARVSLSVPVAALEIDLEAVRAQFQ